MTWQCAENNLLQRKISRVLIFLCGMANIQFLEMALRDMHWSYARE